MLNSKSEPGKAARKEIPDYTVTLRISAEPVGSHMLKLSIGSIKKMARKLVAFPLLVLKIVLSMWCRVACSKLGRSKSYIYN